jgi:hypothetical protein
VPDRILVEPFADIVEQIQQEGFGLLAEALHGDQVRQLRDRCGEAMIGLRGE